MKKFYMMVLTGLFAATSVLAQDYCSDDRFTNWNYFSSFDSEMGVTFGSNHAVVFPPNPNSAMQTLKMDIYQPQGDTMSKRPLIIMEFGGSFVAGTRQDLAQLCEVYSKMGYVAATIDYRVGFFVPNEVTTTQAVVRAMHDMKAAVRFFYKDAQTDNNYRIDTNYIFVSGVSAGAIGALHTAYLSDDSEIPAYLYNDTAGMGGVEGLSGNPGYSSEITAVINYSGTIGDTAWIDPGDVPVVSVHDTGDGVVPYGTQMVDLGGFPTGLEADGTGSIHRHMNGLQIPNRLIAVADNGHVSYFTSGGNLTQNQAAQTAINFSTSFMKDLMCGNLMFEPSNPDTAIIIAAPQSIAEGSITYEIGVYPNPVVDQFVVSIPDKGNEVFNYRIIDVAGRIVMETSSTAANHTILRGGIPAGIYTLVITDENGGSYAGKLIFR